MPPFQFSALHPTHQFKNIEKPKKKTIFKRFSKRLKTFQNVKNSNTVSLLRSNIEILANISLSTSPYSIFPSQSYVQICSCWWFLQYSHPLYYILFHNLYYFRALVCIVFTICSKGSSPFFFWFQETASLSLVDLERPESNKMAIFPPAEPRGHIKSRRHKV